VERQHPRNARPQHRSVEVLLEVYTCDKRTFSPRLCAQVPCAVVVCGKKVCGPASMQAGEEFSFPKVAITAAPASNNIERSEPKAE